LSLKTIPVCIGLARCESLRQRKYQTLRCVYNCSLL